MNPPISDIFDVPLKAAAIQFGLLHPSVASTIPGPRNSDEVQDNIEMLNVKIPSELWKELKRQDLIHQSCPES